MKKNIMADNFRPTMTKEQWRKKTAFKRFNPGNYIYEINPCDAIAGRLLIQQVNEINIPGFTKYIKKLFCRTLIYGVMWLNTQQVMRLVLFLCPYKKVKSIVKDIKSKKLSNKKTRKNVDILKRITVRGMNDVVRYYNHQYKEALKYIEEKNNGRK